MAGDRRAGDRYPPGARIGLKLNLGSGQHPVEGYLNVDRDGSPDLVCDLEALPWPWPDDSVDEVLLHHVLEHLGATPDTFIGVMKELYRVCRNGALVKIRVPHPRHDFYLSDPTHVRPILPATLSLFSRRLNLEWAKGAVSNTPLSLYHGVDFEIEDSHVILDEPWRSDLKAGRITQAEAQAAVERYNNVATEVRVLLRVVKPAAR